MRHKQAADPGANTAQAQTKEHAMKPIKLGASMTTQPVRAAPKDRIRRWCRPYGAEMNNSIKHAPGQSRDRSTRRSSCPLCHCVSRSTPKPRSVIVDDRYGQVEVAGRPEQLL